MTPLPRKTEAPPPVTAQATDIPEPAPAEPGEPQADTRGIAKGVCGAILGSAVTLIQ